MPQEESTEIDALNAMQHGVETGNLSNVIADHIKQTSRFVCITKTWLFTT